MGTARRQITAADLVVACTVRLHVNKLRRGGAGYVHELSLLGVKEAEAESLRRNVAHYTGYPQRCPIQLI